MISKTTTESIICNCGKAKIKAGKVFRFMWERDIVKFKCPKCKQWIKHDEYKWQIPLDGVIEDK